MPIYQPTPEDERSIYTAWKENKMLPVQVSKYEADLKAGLINLPPGVLSPEEIRNISSARSSGKMPEDVAAKYDLDLESGAIFGPPTGIEDVPILDQGVIDAYQAGLFSDSEVKLLKDDIEKQVVRMPEGTILGAPSTVSTIKEQITGNLRRTEETENMPDWVFMPELDVHSKKGLKTALGALAAGPDEIVKIVKAQNPDVEVRQDNMGTYILKSTDGNEYAIKPGLRESDVLRGILVGVAFTPAGRATTTIGQGVKAGLTQAAIEDIQSDVGGDFDLTDVAAAATLGAGGHLLAKGVARAGKRAYNKFSRSAVEAIEETPDDLETLFREAARGKGDAIERLGITGKADPKIAQAADELEIRDLTSGQITMNDRFRQIHASIEGLPGSETAKKAALGRAQTAEAASEVVKKAKGLKSMDQMDTNLNNKMTSTQEALQKASDDLYKEIDAVVDPITPTPAPNLIKFLEEKARRRGGVEKLPPSLRKLLREISDPDDVPTYDLIKDTRQEFTQARVDLMQKSRFSSIDKRLIRQLEEALMLDQKAVIATTNKLPQFEEAQALVAQRKALEESMEFLFGRDLGKSIVPKFSRAMKGLSKQNSKEFVELLNKIPQDMRQEAVATGLQSAFTRNLSEGTLNFSSFTKWYEGMIGNKQARNALFRNLPTETRRSLKNLYRVSKGIDNISKTSNSATARNAIEGADTFMKRTWDVISTFGIAVPFVKAMRAIGAPSGVGIGMSVASSLKRSSVKSAKAIVVDDLLSTNEFINLVRHQTPQAAQRLARTGAWKRFFKEAGEPRELANPEQWMLGAFQAQRQIKENE